MMLPHHLTQNLFLSTLSQATLQVPVTGRPAPAKHVQLHVPRWGEMGSLDRSH